MKKKVLTILAVLLCLSLAVAACDTFEKNAYRSMYTIGTTYDALMESAADLYGQGLITDEQKAEIIKLANIFYVSYQSAVDAFDVYLKLKDKESKEAFQVILAETIAKLGNVEDYLRRIQEVTK